MAIFIINKVDTMEKQEKTIIIRIDDELKIKFTKKAAGIQMKVATRIKYLMKLDVENKLVIINS
jgi:type II secretory ATPase GspE/PulE/Tfp pilus assembly ATPase PilB-like protein